MSEDEYVQLAILLCLDIDTLAKVVEAPHKWSADDLRDLIFRLKEQKDQLVTDADSIKHRADALRKAGLLGNNNETSNP